MAFVTAPAGVIGRHSAFTSGTVRSRPRQATTHGPRMGFTDKERNSFAKIGKGSKWRENIFVGGFPGGEQFLNNWLDKGAKDKIPDLPEYLQSAADFKESVDSRAVKGKLQKLDDTEFFPEFFGQKNADDTVVSSDEVEEEAVDEDVPPSESLYSKWFPANHRNLAPVISMVSEGDFNKDRVSVAMTEICANAADVHFPKEYSGKAPLISISYNGNLATASITVQMADVNPLPTIAPPVANGETITKLVPGAGGGLKLDFEVQGEGPVNVYSDPRCIEKFENMLK